MDGRCCGICGADLPTSHARRAYCSKKCTKAAYTRQQRERRIEQRSAAGVSCETCGISLADRRAKRFCSTRCANIARGFVRPEPLADRLCELPDCGDNYSPRSTLQRCCSNDHVKALYRVEHRDEIKAARTPWNDQRREQYHRRRALKKQASTGRPVLRYEIAERDGHICQLCDEPVEMGLAYPDPLSPSLDHVVPLSKGGAHDPDNVQLAHLRCNVAKGATTAA